MSVAEYYPFNGERGRLRLGLQKISFSDWFIFDDMFADRILHKQKLFKEARSRVLSVLPSSLDIQNEFLKLLLEHLRQYHEEVYKVCGNTVTLKSNNQVYDLNAYDSCPLELASCLVADDICLLEEENDDYKLVAASVCAPTWWDLQEKIGKPLSDIHAPISNLEEKIGHMIRHFLKNLKVADCYQRSNWFIFPNQQLCVFPESVDFSEMKKINENNIESSLFLRSERQTFRRMECSSAIVFNIKVYVEPISIVKKHPAIAQDLVIALKTMDEFQKKSLGINYVEQPLRDYLNKIEPLKSG